MRSVELIGLRDDKGAVAGDLKQTIALNLLVQMSNFFGGSVDDSVVRTILL